MSAACYVKEAPKHGVGADTGERAKPAFEARGTRSTQFDTPRWC